MKLKRNLWIGGTMLTVISSLHAADIPVTANITTDTTWTAGNAYILDKSIFVKNGATLTIEPGTTILGDINLGLNGVVGGGDDTYGSLIITRDGKIMAEGTAEAPIVMTAKADRDAELTPSLADDLDPEIDGGLYGGLIILGDAPINYYSSSTTNANEFSIEGFPAGSSSDILYGGTNSTDNSGVVKYWSIRFGGYVYTSNKEINGLTMGGVGSGTTIEDIEIVANTDDGMEIFGGTVNTKRIAVAFCQDDSFDLDEGHQGFHQFWFAIQNPTGSKGDRGGEWDGGNSPSGIAKYDGTPYTTATIYNATFIGNSATAAGEATENAGFYLDDYFAGQLHNSVIHQFGGSAITKAGDGVGSGAPAPSVFSNNTWGSFGGGAGVLSTLNAAGSPTGTGNSAVGTDPLLRGISRTANFGLDPRPKAASPLRSSSLSAAPVGAPVGFFETTTYRGAFGDTNWLDGWSYLSQQGYLGVVQADVNVTGNITTDTTWSEENAYILDKSIFVNNGATLTIEPGTTILGDINLGLNGAVGGGDDTYGSLIITRNGTIMAEGTAEAPIVMTAKADRDAELTLDLADNLDPEIDGGLYGGLIILGDAPINYYSSSTTNANEFSIEGFPAGSSSDILYGGTNPTDNSGVVKYWSIRFGGYVYTSNKEINGLTMGGVGSGTTIEDIEIVANTDDGMEIFGGTVNTKRIAVAFCQDDSFDLDEGHQGFHQFWFAIQNPTGSKGDRGGEWDGGNSPSGIAKYDGTPYTTATIYNATFIGNSTTAAGEATENAGFYLDDYFAGQLHNSVIHQFGGSAITKAGDGVGSGAPAPSVFSNNTWGSFGGGAGVLSTLNAAGSPTGTGNSAVGTDPLLVGISRTANGGLDPRPNLASPLRSSTLSAAPVAAPVGFFETTTYRGAFGDTNWLNGWSYLSKAGYLSGYPDAGSGSVADADNDGISDAVEAANTALGFNPALNDASTVLGTLKTNDQFTANYTAGQTSVTSNPNAFSLYNTDDILDLRTVGQTTVQKVGNTATLSVPVQKSNTLGGWVAAGSMTLGVDVTSSPTKEFYRLSVEGAAVPE